MATTLASTLPLFHLYGDPPDDQAFDFIHIETIASRSSIHDWTIRAHRHRNLFQILLIERGGGSMTFDAATLPFAAPAAILVPATIAHGFRFEPNVTDGWVLSFTEDAAAGLADRAGEALARLRALAAQPDRADRRRDRAGAAVAAVRRTQRGAQPGARRLPAGDARPPGADRRRRGAARREPRAYRHGDAQPADATVAQLRALVDEFFRTERLLGFYAEKLGMTVDRLNDHVKRATGVTAGHLIRQRVLTEAKRAARVHHAADPGDRRRSRLRRSVPLRPLFPQSRPAPPRTNSAISAAAERREFWEFARQ